MELLNATNMVAGYTLGMQPSGRESLVVVVKGTYSIPSLPDEPPRLMVEQAPLVEADTFSGKPGFSATVYESDYAPMKPRCDVLLNGSAYAPRSSTAERITVSLAVGTLKKIFDVVGDRVWRQGLLGVSPTPPKRFAAMPISYDNAFGGSDLSHENPKYHAAFRENSVGRGFHSSPSAETIDGKPLPNTEERGVAVSNPRGTYRPMALGPVSRAALPRAAYAGTYDDNWLANRFPLLPDDFDERYFQAAPGDQQMDYPQGGEEVMLVHLSSAEEVRFRLPALDLPVEFFRENSQTEKKTAVVDTIQFEPDLHRFMVTWRTSIQLRRNVFEIRKCVVGTMPSGWYRARALGKTYYRSLKHLVDGRA